jgi:hypothetical protein
MQASHFIPVAFLGLFAAACDDTGKAIRDEVKEIDKQEVKRDVKAAASSVASATVQGAKEVAKETGEIVDKIDKKAAEEIRKD